MTNKKNSGFLSSFVIVILSLIIGFTLVSHLEPINNNSFYFPVTSDSEIVIVTPENITYTGPMNGYFPGTYGFENDLPGSDPYAWTVVEDGSTYIRIDDVILMY